jgi:transposase
MSQDQEQARARAQMIVQVQSGQMTAKEAAASLGVSRKTYYKWEKRALEGMIEALTRKEVGRPLQPNDPKIDRLQAEKEQLEKKLLHMEQAEHIRRLLGAERLGKKINN